MDKNNTILLQDYKIKDKIYIRNIEIRRNVNKNYIVVSHQKFIAYDVTMDASLHSLIFVRGSVANLRCVHGWKL